MAKKKEKFMIIDGNAIVHRAFHALPPMTTKDGTLVNAAYGFVTTFFKALKEFKPDYIAVTFDRKEKTFRHEEYKEYKATRVKQADELYEQIPIIKEILQLFNIQLYEKAGFEADDVIGTLCDSKQVDKPDVESIIVTGDLDTLQLVDDNTKVFTMRRGMTDTVLFDERAVKEKFDGLRPDQMIDYKGLRGDPSDNIPGVPGVGEKTAIGLIKQFGSIEEMYKKVEVKEYKNIKVTERIYNLLQENKKEAEQSKHLATIVRDVKLKFKLQDCQPQKYDKDKVFKKFQELEFKSLLNKLPDFDGTEQTEGKNQKQEKAKQDYKYIIDTKEFEIFLKELKRQKSFAFDTETTELNAFKAKLLGISFCWQAGEAYYIDNKKEFLKELKPILEDASIKKIGHNMKFDVKILKMQDIDVKNHYFDTMIASYLLNPGTRAHKLDDLVFRELGYQMTKLADIAEKKQGQLFMDNVDSKKLAEYSCEDADYTWRLVERLDNQLEKNGLKKLFTDIEMPLIEVLVEMELNGIKIDSDHLNELSKKVGRKIKTLEKKIYKLAGQEFNISSPSQMKDILFDKLELSTVGIGKTKTGLSTAAAELEKLRDQHEIIPLIEDYRELSKLQSTYITALPKLVEGKTGRVHTEFNQTITATGRLSSSNPNIQNIPIRTELGREIRKAFVAERGKRLIAADYSQVELRVIACLAKDKNMIEVFEKGEDIHTVTAAKIYGVKEREVTKEMRYAAKEVNFGVLYGMGAWGLASRKKISRAEAKDFIDKYFKSFSRVKDFIEEMKEEAVKKEYVETIFGRRRYLPEINSGVQQVRAAAERMAINMPIQGTAADLMKIAMIEVYEELKKKSPDSKMLLQVHDELVIECPKDETDKIAKIVDEKMEKIHKLCVPIKVDTEVGKNWQEMDKVV